MYIERTRAVYLSRVWARDISEEIGKDRCGRTEFNKFDRGFEGSGHSTQSHEDLLD
jgi:hypothetical protein